MPILHTTSIGILRWLITLQILMTLSLLSMMFYVYTTYPKTFMVPMETTLMGSNEHQKVEVSIQTIQKKATVPIGKHKQFKALPMCEFENISKPVSFNRTIPTWEELTYLSATVGVGGHYKPADCQSKQSTTIIIPYRDRDTHLKVFLRHMHPFLQNQKLNYRMYVVELEENVIFKKTILMNAGFIEASKLAKTDCVIFHDVDMLPLNGLSSYSCNCKSVKHPAHYIKQFNYTAPYRLYIGGVLIFNESVYREVNGFSNLYWGWGGEDDDMRMRLQNSSLPIENPASKELRYWSWSHRRQVEFVNREEMYKSAAERMHYDGLNSVKNMYSVLKIEKRPLYTWIYVSANQTILPVKGIKPIYQPNNITH